MKLSNSESAIVKATSTVLTLVLTTERLLVIVAGVKTAADEEANELVGIVTGDELIGVVEEIRELLVEDVADVIDEDDELELEVVVVVGGVVVAVAEVVVVVLGVVGVAEVVVVVLCVVVVAEVVVVVAEVVVVVLGVVGEVVVDKLEVVVTGVEDLDSVLVVISGAGVEGAELQKLTNLANDDTKATTGALMAVGLLFRMQAPQLT